MHLPRYVPLYVLASVLLAGPSWAFSYATGGCSTAGCAEGEDWIYTNANEVDTALDNLEGVDYLVGTATSVLSNEIVMGTSPGGELGGTWAFPTIGDGISVNFADGSIAAADLASAATVDADATVHCITKQVFSPDGTEPPIDLVGLPFAVTLTRYRCNVLPTTLAETIAITLVECSAGHAACASSDAAALTCDNNGTAWDTTITDAAIDADDQVAMTLAAPSGSLAAGAVTIDLCYSRQVVQ